ncbi:MAG: efflux RND transporter periplasmic adaptor subunit [Planctomycetota bacterium]|jgi:multidrug efflux pump subunit AcrA (membrane-fusion protein)
MISSIHAAVRTALVGSLITGFAPHLQAQTYESESSAVPKPSRATVPVEGAILKTIESTSVAAQVAGVLQSLNVREGSRVHQGEELARIRDVTVRLQLERTQTALEVARKKQDSDIDEQIANKNREVAFNEHQRALEANAQIRNVYPPSEMDRLKLVLDRSVLEERRAAYLREIAKLESSLAEVEVQQSQELLLRHRIIAPCSGMVVAVEKRVGEWVEPGTVAVKIVEIERLRVEGFINAADTDLNWIGSKASVRVEIAGESIETEGELVFISPDANPVNGQVRVFIEVDNRDQKLRPGLRPTVHLQGKP